MTFISFRRNLLDKELIETIPLFKGKILDVGGSKKRRGQFKIPKDLENSWHTFNKDISCNPDFIGDLPLITGIQDCTYDQLVLTEVLEYIENYHLLIQECHRILVKDGLFFVSFPFMSPLHGDAQEDKFRITTTFFEYIISNKFKIIKKKNLGGPLCVFFDGLRNFILHKKNESLIKKVTWKTISLSSGIIEKVDSFLFNTNKNDTFHTGPFYILKKI